MSNGAICKKNKYVKRRKGNAENIPAIKMVMDGSLLIR
jgi:hypothetical protein